MAWLALSLAMYWCTVFNALQFPPTWERRWTIIPYSLFSMPSIIFNGYFTHLTVYLIIKLYMISCTQMSTTFVNCWAADIRGEILLFKPLRIFLDFLQNSALIQPPKCTRILVEQLVLISVHLICILPLMDHLFFYKKVCLWAKRIKRFSL